MTIDTARQDVINEYFRQGKSVCPYAKGCDLVFAINGGRAQWAETFLRTFRQTQMDAGVVVADTDLKPAGVREWAEQVFLDLFAAAMLIQHVPADVTKQHVTQHVAPILRNRDHPMRIHIGLDHKALVTICMAPIYAPAHPRYAPLPIVVVTWLADILGAQHRGDAALHRIRQAMTEQHGFVYDANELVLPPP